MMPALRAAHPIVAPLLNMYFQREQRFRVPPLPHDRSSSAREIAAKVPNSGSAAGYWDMHARPI